MLDTSDGLADASWLLSESSGVRVLLEAKRIPWVHGLVKARASMDGSRLATAFYGGDYELLAAISPRAWARAQKTPGAGVTRVGRVVRGEGAFLISAVGSHLLPPAGWQPFGTRQRRTGSLVR
jgi:thiamine monophosphate kinase